MMDPAFFTLHQNLPREAPGDDESVHWALRLAGIAPDARLLDAGCGPGGDIAALLAHVPRGHLTAVDLHAPFIAEARARFPDEPRLSLHSADMTHPPGGPFDLIWCAGALYFPGIEAGLTAWREALVPGGWVAFTDAVWLTDTPSEEARTNWAEYAEMTDAAGVRAAVERAGYRVAGTRLLPDAAWEAYYTPIDARIAELRAGNPDTALAVVLHEAEAEAACWRAHRDEFGYMAVVAQRL